MEGGILLWFFLILWTGTCSSERWSPNVAQFEVTRKDDLIIEDSGLANETSIVLLECEINL